MQLQTKRDLPFFYCRETLRTAFLFVVFALAPVGASTVHAQQRPPQQQVRQDTARERQIISAQQAEIIRRLRESGLTRDQARERLRLAGQDPSLVDRYFDEIARRDSTGVPGARLDRLATPLPRPSGDLIEAMRTLGIITETDPLFQWDPSLPGDSVPMRRPPRRRPQTRAELEVFGRELFSATTTQFEPILTGPVDPEYRIGPGDRITLVVTGDVETGYNLTVTREGTLVVPEVGQVLVNGLTMEELRRRLNDRLARVYSGIRAGSTQFDVLMERSRTNLVYLVGDVEVPGSFQIPGTATVFNALYMAGGPTVDGSFRNIEVRRNNRTVRQVDLYDYLLRGDKGGDIRLEQGDIVFVPVAGTQVSITGSVRRPAIYELRPGETLADLLRFAGGVQAEAAIERVQIDRIIPPAQRTPGNERKLVDVPLNAMATVTLENGDHITVLTISEERRNRVAVRGDVQRPGDYEFRPGMTAADLISSAFGLMSTAYTPTAHIVRLNRADSTTSIIRVTFDDAAAANSAARVQLQDLDELVVFGRARMAIPQEVDILGYVKAEGTYPFSRGMSIADLVLIAGGFREGARSGEAEVARKVTTDRGDSIARIYNVPISLDARVPPFELVEGDQVFIRRVAGYQELETVNVDGQVLYPGPYTLGSRNERVTHVLRRAGGLTTEAYPAGFRLVREGKPVGVNLPAALRRPGGPDDLTLEPGDTLFVPRYDPTVLVIGAVAFESRVRYERGLSMNDYLRRAGGVREDGDGKRAAVRYPNGELRTPRSFLGFRDYPSVQPGSTIVVPTRPPESRANLDQILTRTLSTVTALATLILSIRALDNN